MKRLRTFVFGGIALLFLIGAVALVTLSARPSGSSTPGGGLLVIGAENEYADVLSQIGGSYVQAIGIMSNPSTDPHSYEASTRNARDVAKASLIVQNGLGYDTFMNRLEAAAPNPHRVVLTAAQIVGAPASTPNPHLWYQPSTMPAVADRVARELAALQPQHRAYFMQRLATFHHSLGTWQQSLNALRADYAGTKVAVTEPVADYLLQAAGLDVATPWSYQAAVMNGQDPSPESVAAENSLIEGHKVALLAYNLQSVDPSTEALLALAKRSGVPIVGVYETMPKGYDYQHWMLTETLALRAAIAQHRSEVQLP